MHCYQSQKHQDKWIIEEVFPSKKGGFFVDLAASNGIHFNNTYVLEKDYDWNGICIEPNPLFLNELSDNRSCTIVPYCIDSIEREISFRIDNLELGGIIDKDTDNNYSKRSEELYYSKKHNGIITLNTKTLEQILDELNAPSIIDYLSLDVEGAETRILRNFPFEKYIFLAMTIERPSVELNYLLKKHGYVFVKNSKKDFFYVHQSISNFKEIKKSPFKQVPQKTK